MNGLHCFAGLRESKLYKPLLEQDRRCVVICDGFYEWQKLKSGGGGKQPYFVYAPQKDYDGSTVAKAASENLEDNWSETEGWYGTKPLFMAGLYSVWYADSDRETRQKPVYNYTIITRYVRLSGRACKINWLLLNVITNRVWRIINVPGLTLHLSPFQGLELNSRVVAWPHARHSCRRRGRISLVKW